jgi:twitching motility protein PilU
LIPTVEGKRTAAIEILLGSPRIRELIHRGDVGTIKEVMEKSEGAGMQTFDSCLIKLYQEGKISMEEAIRNADSQNNVKLRISLSESNGKGAASSSGLSLVDKEEEKDEEVPAC